MTEIQKARTFPASSDRCLGGLVRIWPYLNIRVRKSDPADGSAEGSWQPGSGATFLFRAECKDAAEGACEVTLRHDLQWTSRWSRPVVANEALGQKLNARTLEQMERIFSTLGEYLEDETKFTARTPPASLALDHVAWAVGAAISIAARLLVGAVQVPLHPAFSQFAGPALPRVIALAGVLVGALVAGLLKRRTPEKGSAFFEGLVVAIVNLWLSLVIHSIAITLGTVDWIVYCVVGVVAASLASMRIPVRNAP